MHANWPKPVGPRIRTESAKFALPVLFLMNWDDTRAPREDVFELFDLLGSNDKRLVAYPGDHGTLPPEALDCTADFLSHHLDAE